MKSISNRWLLNFVFACGLSLCVSVAAQDLASIRAKAEAGDPVAMFGLAILYESGKDVPIDRVEAAKWYLRSAEAGFAEAQNSIGSMYQAGQGVEKDFKKAREWYEKAASQGHIEGTHNLAFMYDEGLGVEEDNRKAIELYVKAAEGGFVKSMLNLGITYAVGDGVPTNYIEAYKWLDLARFYTQFSKDMNLKWGIRGKLDALRKQMSRTDILAAEKLTAEWDQAHRKAQ